MFIPSLHGEMELLSLWSFPDFVGATCSLQEAYGLQLEQVKLEYEARWEL